jgi:hypothetical protein
MPVSSYIQQTQLEQARKVQIGLLFNACELGDYDEVFKIVEANEAAGDEWNAGGYHNGIESQPSLSWLLDAQCDTLWTPVMFAARYGHLQIVKYLA